MMEKKEIRIGWARPNWMRNERKEKKGLYRIA